MRVKALANITLAGRFLPLWTVADVPPSQEVADAAAARLLVVENEDGSFPDSAPIVERRCCGG